MRDMTRHELAGLDRWLTTDPHDTFDEDALGGPEYGGDPDAWADDTPDPCDDCDWVGCHAEGCPHHEAPDEPGPFA